jgi:hypothetical protein
MQLDFNTLLVTATCECGCGQPLPLAKYPSGQSRFVHGHNARGPHTRFTRACLRCGQTFTTIPSVMAKGAGRFCSRSCVEAYRVRPIEELFWAHVDKQGPVVQADLGPCWLWTAGTVNAGYGKFGSGKLAHRVAYELVYGTIPSGLFVLHHCDVRTCVNPTHLFVGNHRDNMADMRAKGRAARNLTGAKLTANEVAEIRRLAAQGVERWTLMRSYNVSVSTISVIVNRKTWKHVD